VFVAHNRNSVFEPLAKWDRYITEELLRGYREIAEGLVFGQSKGERISDNPQIPKPARPPGFPAPGLDLQQLDGGARIARFPAVGNVASIQAGSRDIREIPDPSRSLALGSKDDTRLFATAGRVYHVRLQP
jgi:hypothetical protein